jgi:hypothetical protein
LGLLKSLDSPLARLSPIAQMRPGRLRELDRIQPERQNRKTTLVPLWLLESPGREILTKAQVNPGKLTKRYQQKSNKPLMTTTHLRKRERLVI